MLLLADEINEFESSVNSYGGKTTPLASCDTAGFESSVNSYGGKTCHI